MTKRRARLITISFDDGWIEHYADVDVDEHTSNYSYMPASSYTQITLSPTQQTARLREVTAEPRP